MERKNKKQSNRRANARYVLVLSCVLVLAVVLTFGVTMSYFGGKSEGYSVDFVLKAGIQFKANESGSDYQSLTFDSEYLVPGTTLNSTCKLTISSLSSDASVPSVNGLLRASFLLNGEMANFIELNYSESNPIYVYIGSTAESMTEANKVARLIRASGDDSYFYLVNVGATEITNNTLLYEIPCVANSGEVGLIFNLPFTVLNESSSGSAIFNNSYSGKNATFNAEFTVIQSEFYEAGNPTALPQTYRNAKTVFDDVNSST